MDWTQTLRRAQGFYDDQAVDQGLVLLASPDLAPGLANLVPPASHEMVTGIGKATATAGGAESVSVMRFMQHDVVIHPGETLEWDNTDPVTPHTITFAVEPANTKLPSANLTLDADGPCRHQHHHRQREFRFHQRRTAGQNRAGATVARHHTVPHHLHSSRRLSLQLRFANELGMTG